MKKIFSSRGALLSFSNNNNGNGVLSFPFPSGYIGRHNIGTGAKIGAVGAGGGIGTGVVGGRNASSYSSNPMTRMANIGYLLSPSGSGGKKTMNWKPLSTLAYCKRFPILSFKSNNYYCASGSKVEVWNYHHGGMGLGFQANQHRSFFTSRRIHSDKEDSAQLPGAIKTSRASPDSSVSMTVMMYFRNIIQEETL